MGEEHEVVKDAFSSEAELQCDGLVLIKPRRTNCSFILISNIGYQISSPTVIDSHLDENLVGGRQPV